MEGPTIPHDVELAKLNDQWLVHSTDFLDTVHTEFR